MTAASPPKISLRTSIRRLLQLSGRNQVWLYIAMAMAVLNAGADRGRDVVYGAFCRRGDG